MKRIVFSAVAAAVLMGGAFTARADEAFNPDCHLQGINRDLDSVIGQIKSSPAYGHASGHYAKSIEDIERVKKQLHDGCHDWNASLHR